MFPYILLIVITFVFSFVGIQSGAKRKSRLKLGKIIIGNSEYVKQNNIAIHLFFLIFFLILIFRDTSIGRDLHAYESLFEQYSRMDFKTLFNIDGDLLYAILNWIIGKTTDNYRVLIVTAAAMTLYPIYKQYIVDRRHAFMKIVLFMNMSTFIMFFSGLRQSIAIAIGMIAYEFVKNKKIIPYIITVLIAIGFHHSAFVLFLMYPMFYIKLKRRHLFFIIPFTAGIYLTNETLFVWITAILNNLSGGLYEAELTSTGAVTMIILFALFAALSYVITDDSVMDEEAIGLRNLLLLALWFQCFAPLHNLAMRFNYYYLVFIPMALSRVLECKSSKYRQVAKLAEIVITVCLLYYYLSHTYRACVSGISALDTYPYVPFWRN